MPLPPPTSPTTRLHTSSDAAAHKSALVAPHGMVFVKYGHYGAKSATQKCPFTCMTAIEEEDWRVGGAVMLVSAFQLMHFTRSTAIELREMLVVVACNIGYNVQKNVQQLYLRNPFG